ncbi:MAG: phosphohistidine phosphatase SixA [Spongiibacteraceae bacterium]|jgi:phosphohistidine phosphatase|nr:phosphohistidine phosphatase SixA [Spongiibacteraceae bacterium]
MSLHLRILRHGEAAPARTSDAERPLTARGLAEARQMGAWLATQPHPPSRILVSPLRRAQETAAAVQASLPDTQLATVDWLVPETRPLVALAELESLTGSVLLVTHQPFAGALAGLLAHGDIARAEPMVTAGLAELAVEMAVPGMARLVRITTPASLADSDI